MRRGLGAIAALFVTPPAGPATAGVAAAADTAVGQVPCTEAPQTEWRPPVDAQDPATSGPGFAETDGAVAAAADWRAATPDSAVVLGAGADAAALAAAVAGELRARGGARTALLLVWDPSGTPAAPIPAWPAARGLAAKLGPSHEVAARGRLVRVQLPPDPETAAAAAARLTAAARVPSVLALRGPRSSAFDGLLRTRDLLVLLESADLPHALSGLAALELRELNQRVLVERPLGGSVRRLLSSSGLGRWRALGGRVLEAMA